MWAIAASSFVLGTGFGVLAAIGAYVVLQGLTDDEGEIAPRDIHHGVPINRR